MLEQPGIVVIIAEIVNTSLLFVQCDYRTINTTRCYEDTVVRLPEQPYASHKNI